jgi:hypothetical protein
MTVVLLVTFGLLISVALAVSLMLTRDQTLSLLQKLGWLALVWLVPLAGAWIAWMMLTEEIGLQQYAAGCDDDLYRGRKML